MSEKETAGFGEGVGPTVGGTGWEHYVAVVGPRGSTLTKEEINAELIASYRALAEKRDQQIAELSAEIGIVYNRLQASHDMIERLRAMIEAMSAIGAQTIEKNAGLP